MKKLLIKKKINLKNKKKNLNHSILKISNKYNQIVKPNAKNFNKLPARSKILNYNFKKHKNLKKNIYNQLKFNNNNKFKLKRI